MERPVFKPIGTPVEELDTPVLVVDLDVLDRNIETLHSFFRQRDAKVRPHVESHRCPAIAHRQLAAGGTVSGISVTTIGEAEVFAQQGFSDIFVANEVVTPQKMGRLCSLARQATITVAADSGGNVADLSAAAETHGATLGVVVDIHTRLDRCGVESGQPALELARAIGKAGGLRFAGLTAYEGPILDADGRDDLIQRVLDTSDMIQKDGLEVAVVSLGSTYDYEVAGATSGVTEVPAGSYALMDQKYSAHRTQFGPAASVMATVISRQDAGTAIVDCGQKSITTDTGLAAVKGLPGATLSRMSAEHGFVEFDDSAPEALDLGDKVWLTPWDVGNAVNLYDYIHAVRDGKLEAVWDVAARGRYR